MSLLYKAVLPDSIRGAYKPNENVTFKLSFEGHKIKKESLRLNGVLKFTDTTGDATTDFKDCQYDALTGIHGAFVGIVTEFDKVGVVENLQEYPRWHKMKMGALQDDSQALAVSDNVTSLKLSDDRMTNSFLYGAKDTKVLPFSCNIDIMMNRTNNDIPYSKTGDIKIQFRIASNAEFYSASDTTRTRNWVLEDLELTYQCSESLPADKKKVVSGTAYYNVKHTISSNLASISTKVPAICNAVSCSFIPTADENQQAKNNLAVVRPPGISSIKWNFNDSLSMVHFEMKTDEEILHNYFASMGRSPYHYVRSRNYNNFGVGLNFGTPVDLNKNKIGLEFTSSVDNTAPYSLYMFFHSFVSF